MKIFTNTRRLLSCGDTRTRYLLQGVLVFVIGCLDVASAYALGMVTKNLMAADGQNLLRSFLYFAAATILIALTEWYRSVRMTRLMETAESNYRKITARCLLRADYQHIQKLESGDLISRVVSDCRYAASNSGLLIDGLRNVLIPILLIAMMFAVDWRVGGGYLLLLIPTLIYPRLTKGSLSEIPAFRRAYAAMHGQTKDLIQNRSTLKTFRLQKKADQWVETAVEDYRKKGVRGIGKIYTVNISALAINVLPLFGCAIVGASLLYRNLFSAQGFVMAVMMASVATGELLKLPNVMVNFPSGLVASDRLFEIWDLPAEASGDTAQGGQGAAVTFDHVTFRYPEQDAAETPLLDDLSFTVRQGEKIALVGHSGCGKSSVLKLITGLYRPQEGAVRVLGTAVGDWELKALRAQMSVLQQNPFVFKGSIRDNILLGSPGADAEALAYAAECAKLTEWIDQQPGGWDADTGEHGSLLSGGLQQRVGLARLFLKNAPIELLDEATSALDATHQKEILNALRECGPGKTRITIAHRLTTVTDCDRILFLHQGKIAEEGTHAELMKRRGLYYSLYTAQVKEERHGQ